MKTFKPVYLLTRFLLTSQVYAFLPDQGSADVTFTCQEPDMRQKLSAPSQKSSFVHPPWLVYLPEDDSKCRGISPNAYWYNDQIHTFGNTGMMGKFHAFVAPVATKIIDRAAYENQDVRAAVSNLLHQKLCSNDIGGRYCVLDLCCGVGISTRALNLAFVKDADLVLGVDTSPEMIGMARGLTRQEYCTQKWRAKSNDYQKKSVAQFVQGNAERTRLPSQSFDLVTIMYSFHEAPYLGRYLMLREARRLLKHNGILAVVDICPEYTPSDTMLAGEPYVLEYQQNIMRQMARMTGFVDKEYHTLVPDHVGMWISSRYIEEDKRHSFRS